jgi:hypothetical protein
MLRLVNLPRNEVHRRRLPSRPPVAKVGEKGEVEEVEQRGEKATQNTCLE